MPTVLVQHLSSNERDSSFEVVSGRILFDELERQGLKLPHGCLAGSCGSCFLEVISGEENLSLPSYVETDTINAVLKNMPGPNKKIRLSCRAKVNGDITIAIK